MNNKSNSSPGLKKAAAFFVYISASTFFTILAASHLAAGFFDKHFGYDIAAAAACGIIAAAAASVFRIKTGRMNDPVVNMRKYKYWAFAELVLFYAFLLLGAVHLFDKDGRYIMQELLPAVFAAVFFALVNVLHLIKKDKFGRNKQ